MNPDKRPVFSLTYGGQADLHADLFKTAEREKFLTYSHPILYLDYCILSHPIIRPISSLEKTSGFIVGIAKGFSIDLINLLSQKAGFNVRFVSGATGDEYLERVKAGELDVMLSIGRSEERQQFLQFTAPSYISILRTLYTREGTPMVSSIEDLYGKRFAVPKGFYFHDILKKFPKIEIVEVENTTEAILAVTVGKADALFDVMPVVHYLMDQLRITNLTVGGTLGMAYSAAACAKRFICRIRCLPASKTASFPNRYNLDVCQISG